MACRKSTPPGGAHLPGPWIQQTYKSGVKVEVQLCLNCGDTLNRRVSK